MTPAGPAPEQRGQADREGAGGRTDWIVRAAFLLVSLLALAPALAALTSYANRYDWRYFESMAEVARRSVVWFGQAPLWNPYSCGGEVDLANPQSMSGAPTFVFTLLFGTAVGFKLSLLAYTLLALDGMYRLGRQLGLGRTGSAVAAAAYALSGYQAMHLSVGHINFAGVSLYPYLVLCFDRSQRRWEWALPAGAVAAWIAVLGGTFTPAIAAEILAMWALAVIVSPLPAGDGVAPKIGPRLGRALGLLALAGAVALLVGAARMLPALEFIGDHPRPLFRRTPDVTALSRLPWDLFAWRGQGGLPGRKYAAHEYTARLPLLVGPLSVWALLCVRRMDARGRRLLGRLVALAVLGAALAMGNFAPWAPWSLLQKLPVLRDLRVPSRHLVLVTLWLGLLGGMGADQLVDIVRGRLSGRLAPRRTAQLAAVLAGVLFLGCALDAAAFFAAKFGGVFTVQLVAPPGPPPFFHVQGSWQQMRELIFEGHGVLSCDEEAPLQRAEALDVGDLPQARLVDPAAGTIESSRVTPNVRTVALTLTRADTLLLLNSNWNEHFKVEPAAARIQKVAGRLAVDLSALGPGRHVVTVRYAPRSFAVGAVLGPLSMLVLLAVFVAASRKSRRAA